MFTLFGVHAQTPHHVDIYKVSTDNGIKTTIAVDTVTGFALMDGHTYTTRGAWLVFENMTDEVNSITIVRNEEKPFIIKSIVDKYGVVWQVNGTKTPYASLAEVWYRRMRK